MKKPSERIRKLRWKAGDKQRPDDIGIKINQIIDYLDEQYEGEKKIVMENCCFDCVAFNTKEYAGKVYGICRAVDCICHKNQGTYEASGTNTPPLEDWEKNIRVIFSSQNPELVDEIVLVFKQTIQKENEKFGERVIEEATKQHGKEWAKLVFDKIINKLLNK